MKIRSVLTCASRRGVCTKCYGRDLATGKLVELGQAVGVIAAQSIGEPGTQLTMRTFHIGGTARVSEQTTAEAKYEGTVKFEGLQTVQIGDNELVVMNRNGSVVVQDARGRDRERYPVVYGARVRVKDGQTVDAGQTLARVGPVHVLHPHRGAGDDPLQGHHRRRHGARGRRRGDGPVAADHHRLAGREEAAGDRNPRQGQQGRAPLPHAVARPPDGGRRRQRGGGRGAREDPARDDEDQGHHRRSAAGGRAVRGAAPARPGGHVRDRRRRQARPVVKGQRKIFVVPDDAEQREYSIPRGVHVNVQEGERVRAGEPLMDGPRDPHDILKVLGARELQKYLVNEIQEVYRLQGVAINDKHIEVIVRQMLRWVKVEDVGDTEFLIDEQVDKFRFDEENERVITDGGRPATGRPLLLGITKASLSTDSFISAASFQETTRVLTEASISGKVDYLRGLKENVTMGRLIPAGTGFEYYRHVTHPGRRAAAAAAGGAAVGRRARARSRDGVLRGARGSPRRPRRRAGGIGRSVV